MMIKMLLMSFMLALSVELQPSEIYLPVCKDNDDKILMHACDELYLYHRPYCGPNDDPYNEHDNVINIRRVIQLSLNCVVTDMEGFLLQYFLKQIDCADWWEKWFQDVESKRVFDMDTCVMRSYNNFFDVENFITYVKNQGIPKENYTNMVICATCYRDTSINDFYHVHEKFPQKRDELIQYLIDRQKETSGKKESLIQDLKNHALYRQWNSNRFLSTILRCYLEGDLLNRIVSMPPHRPHPEAYLKSNRSRFFRPDDEPDTEPGPHSVSRGTPKTSTQPLSMLIIGCALAVLFILGMKLYKSRIHFLNKVRIEGDGIYYDIRRDIIENV